MKVRIEVSIAGNDFSFCPGEEVEMPDEQATIWIGSGLASPLEAPPAASDDASTKQKPRRR